MSRTFTNRSQAGRATNTRGRGRGTMATDPISSPQTKSPPGMTPEDEEQHIKDRDPQWRGGYTVIPPNETKRQNITQKAQKEEESYKQYKEGKKLGHVSYVGTVGGGTVTESMARQRAHQASQSSRFQTQKKIHDYKEDKKRRENEVIEKKKLEQRRKAEALTNRPNASKDKIDEDRRRTNEAFLRRLESQTLKEPVHFPGVSTALRQDSDDAAGTDQITASNLPHLAQRFPHLDPEALSDILHQTGGDVEQASQLLIG